MRLLQATALTDCAFLWGCYQTFLSPASSLKRRKMESALPIFTSAQQLTPPEHCPFPPHVCMSSAECPWAVTHCSRPVYSTAVEILGRFGEALCWHCLSKTGQLNFVPLTFFKLIFVLQAESFGDRTWTDVSRFLEELPLSKFLCLMQLTHFFT